MFLGAVILMAAMLTDSSNVILVVSGVVLVCVGGLASVLTSPSLSVVDSGRDDQAPGVL